MSKMRRDKGNDSLDSWFITLIVRWFHWVFNGNSFKQKMGKAW